MGESIFYILYVTYISHLEEHDRFGEKNFHVIDVRVPVHPTPPHSTKLSPWPLNRSNGSLTKMYSIPQGAPRAVNPRSANKYVHHLLVLKPSCQLLDSTFQWVNPSSRYLPVKVEIFIYH